MSYIGQIPTTGDNSFRTLDDITTFTQTFDGSSSVVSIANSTITFIGHRFVTGQRVYYSTTGTAIGNLTNNSYYYIIKQDQNSIKLASSYANAINNVFITLSGLGSGTNHSLNVSFDGINTKFKATYNNGTKAQINRASQLQISINGVLQQPSDTSAPVNGFGIDSDSTIVFSVAPTVSDIFWGFVIANSYPTFDVSDNTVDTFTGNGSNTNFTLSKTPANNQNVLVTINGVVQYPSDATNSRSYAVNGNVLTFTDAPANGSSVQVRHIGFAGATSSEVTGFYGRIGNVVLTTSDNINVGSIATIGNINSSGIVTAIRYYGDGSFLTGVSASGGFSLSTNTTNQNQYLTYATSFGSTTGLGATTALVFNPSSGNLGIGTTNPTTKLDVFVNGGEGLPTVVTGERMRVISNDVVGRSGFLSIIAGSSAYSGVFFGDKDAADVGKIRYYHADNSLQFLVNQTTEAFRATSSGNVLIGSATSTGTASQPLQVTGGAYVSGNVGIGITIPQSLLHIESASPTQNLIASSGNAVLRLADSATSGTRKEFTIVLDNANDRVDIQAVQQNVGVRNITLNAYGGNIGIGTTNPLGKLSVCGSGSNTLEMGFSALYGNYIESIDRSAVTAPDFTYFIAGNASHRFYTTAAERVRIDGSGNVGIGSTNPTTILDVRSTSAAIARLRGGTGAAQGAALYISRANTGNTLTAFGDRAAVIGGTVDQASTIWTDGSVPLVFDVGSTEKVRITSDGNVGIGTTIPTENLSVFSPSNARLSVKDTSGIAVILIGNTDSGGVNNPAAIAGANGSVYFGGGTSWSGGGTLSYSMVVEDTGRVGIGTLVPSQELHVQGNARITGGLYDSSNSVGIAGSVLSSTGTGLSWIAPPEDVFVVPLSDETSNISIGNTAIAFRAPFPMKIVSIPRANVSTAATQGLVTVDIRVAGTTILGANKLTIDANETSSTTATTATTLASNPTSIADDALIQFDITGIGTGAKGLKVNLYYYKNSN